MKSIDLYDYQQKAVEDMKNGCILCGSVGSGKSRTALAYYYMRQGGNLKEPCKMGDRQKDLYIITTARKRDTGEWEGEMKPFLLGTELYSARVYIDSWNNIPKYKDVKDAFFILDEQRVVGYGEWTKSFLKIASNNDWILLSATPGDTWMDYIPVFVANGFYKNKSEFIHEHVVYCSYCKNFPKIDRFINIGRLVRLRNNILVQMDYHHEITKHNIDIYTFYDEQTYKDMLRYRWNKDTEEPIKNASELCYQLRKIVNDNYNRIAEVDKILREKNRIIVFYNFDYELELLKNSFGYPYNEDWEVAEWNGHKHQPIPNSRKWLYLVQYTAGAEGWNCISTDTIVFFSQNYSYKVMVQSAGRIDRLNTPYKDLYYYHIKTHSSIDLAIAKALKSKKKFNEGKFVLM